MLIAQLYRSNSLNERGFEILQRWNNLTNLEKQRHVRWLADQLRGQKVRAPNDIAVKLAARLGVRISKKFPPP